MKRKMTGKKKAARVRDLAASKGASAKGGWSWGVSQTGTYFRSAPLTPQAAASKA